MLSAYRIHNHVYLVSTRTVADPAVPRTLPIGSARLTPDEARLLAAQTTAAAEKPETTRTPRVRA